MHGDLGIEEPARTRPERLLLRVEDVCELLSVSRSTVYAMIGRGDLPSVKIAGCRRVPMDQLRSWLRQNGAG
jgi:excisionase family DNA binding protein